MTSLARRRLPFGLSIGSIVSSFIIIGSVQVLIAGLRTPLSNGAITVINWITGKISITIPALRMGSPQWKAVLFEDVVISVLFLAVGLGIGAWLRRDSH